MDPGRTVFTGVMDAVFNDYYEDMLEKANCPPDWLHNGRGKAFRLKIKNINVTIGRYILIG